MKRLIFLSLSIFMTVSLSAQTYTIVSRNNDTIKMVPNALGSGANALKSLVPGSAPITPQYRLIKKVDQGKESLIFVDFTRVLDKILVAYETDLVTPGEWKVTTISYADLYNVVTRQNAIYLSGEIFGMKVEMFQRPPVIWEDIVNIDGVEFPLPLKLAAYESDLAQKAQKAAEKEQQRLEKELAAAEKNREKEAANAEKAAEIEAKKAEQEKLIIEMASKDENKAYVAYLIKAQRYDLAYVKEIKQFFSWDEIQQLMQSYSVELLEKMSKNHSKYFEKYEILN